LLSCQSKGLAEATGSRLCFVKGTIMTQRIAVDTQIHFGKPCVAGTRIPVHSVLELVREGLAFSDIIRDYYPDLEPEDIRACVQYAIDVVTLEDIHLAPTP
jgi:uncharacterized protein (DUF433 family)